MIQKLLPTHSVIVSLWMYVPSVFKIIIITKQKNAYVTKQLANKCLGKKIKPKRNADNIYIIYKLYNIILCYI